jgi:hypothetical protein
LGEYVARIYDQVRGRPHYVVSRIENSAVAGDRLPSAPSSNELESDLGDSADDRRLLEDLDELVESGAQCLIGEGELD